MLPDTNFVRTLLIKPGTMFRVFFRELPSTATNRRKTYVAEPEAGGDIPSGSPGQMSLTIDRRLR